MSCIPKALAKEAAIINILCEWYLFFLFNLSISPSIASPIKTINEPYIHFINVKQYENMIFIVYIQTTCKLCSLCHFVVAN